MDIASVMFMMKFLFLITVMKVNIYNNIFIIIQGCACTIDCNKNMEIKLKDKMHVVVKAHGRSNN